MIISMISAAASNDVIGKNGDLPWRLPADMKFFKETTTGHVIIMGRKTFEAFREPLLNRTHMIITRQADYQVPEGCYVFGSLEEAIRKAEELGEEECFIIGGGEIYELGMELADRIYLTRIFEEFEGDTVFPKIDPLRWKLVEGIVHDPDEKNKYKFAFTTYERVKIPDMLA